MLLRGEAFETFRAPGLSLWLAGWYSLFGAGQLAAMLSLPPFHLALGVAVYLYTAQKINPRAALIALAIVTFYPALVFHSVWPLTQVPLAAILVLALYLLDGEHGLPHILCAGLLLGLAVLIRPNSITLIPAFGLIFLLNGNTRILPRTALLAAVALTPALLWSAREYRQTGNVVFINYTNSMNFYLGNNRYTPLYKTWWFGSHGEGEREVPPDFSAELNRIDSLPLNTRNRIYLHLALAEITAHPLIFTVRTLSRIRSFFAFDSYTGTVAISRFGGGKPLGALLLALDMLFYLTIMAASLFLYCGNGKELRDNPVALWVCVIVLAYAFPFWLAFSHPTYHLPIMPLLAVPASATLDKISGNPTIWADSIYRLKTNFKLLSALVILALIQLEWVIIMLPSFSGTN
ncbi:hypothetical protein ES708_25695 [subsurface metagenome]